MQAEGVRTVQQITLIAATITTGLIAGLFFTYANSIMPALRQTGDATYVTTMQRINMVILNPLFLLLFTGGLVASAAAAVVTWQADDRAPLPWLVAGVVLYGAMFAITQAVNVPLNNELDRAGDAEDDPARAADLRRRFESTWVPWNHVRAIASAAAFTCLVVALFVHS